MRPVDPSLTDQVLDEPPDRVVDERRDDRSLEAEAPVQAARDVVLAAALPRRELPGRRDAHVARIEPEHHLAERDEVVPALGAGAQREGAHRDSSTSRRASRARTRIASNSPAAIIAGLTIQLPPQASTCGTAR